MRVHSFRKKVIAEINMIPLIDVALILLIIFMVITPFLVQSELKVNLPKSSSAAGKTRGETIKVQILGNGRVVVKGRTMSFSRLEKELVLHMSESYDKTVLIQADKSVDIQKVVTALDIAKKLGAKQVGIGVLIES